MQNQIENNTNKESQQNSYTHKNNSPNLEFLIRIEKNDSPWFTQNPFFFSNWPFYMCLHWGFKNKTKIGLVGLIPIQG